ncbi:MAG: BamA/TamA family outer membrane protein [Bacteroidales bacterium]|nr:BamA/TamA family outer membrane protein [Bacteroidales bacterium]
MAYASRWGMGWGVKALLVSVILLSGCSVTRHIPEDKAVVSRVYIEVDGRPSNNSKLRLAVAQNAYHRTFGILPMSAWIWHNDTVSAWHRFRAKLGAQPPVYDEELALRTDQAMQRALVNQGYLEATVTHTTEVRKRKAEITYHATRRQAHRVNRIKYMVEDPLLEPLIMELAPDGALKKGVHLDRSILESERTRLTSQMRDSGFYDFNKENISFLADTVERDKRVDLTMVVRGIHNRYMIKSVHFVPDYDLATGQRMGKPDYLRAKVLVENCYIQPGTLYSESNVRKTYSAFSRLHILKYVNVRLEPTGQPNELACTVYLSPQNPQAVQFELDGTNTAGDLGFAASLTYQHRNLFRGSESYSATLKGGYESLSGDLSGFVNDNYMEYSFDNQIDFPRYLFPFMSAERRRAFSATTAIKAGYSYQSRPEYTRIITNAGLVYKWNTPAHNLYHVLNAIDLSYVYLPEISLDFSNRISQYSTSTSNSFRSHFILSSSYNIYAGNGRSMMNSRPETSHDLWMLRLSPEIAGNLLNALAKQFAFEQSDGQYQIFNLPFEQYAKFDVDWACSKYLTDRSRLAMHLSGGIAVPYGNSNVMPFEKRYYSGGANSVRGWNVRRLGPGRYTRQTSSSDSSGTEATVQQSEFFYQCGDVRLDASVELRSRLFWKFEFAAFIDAGNVWTLKDYPDQPNGVISKDFYREIAMAWGLGLRMVTDFVVLRADYGIKAYDPASDTWLIKNPFGHDKRTFHFAVGYPF